MGFGTRIGCCCALFLLVFFAGGVHGGEPSVSGRIVSLAPSITETLFAMGLGERIVGTTEHSDYPPEAMDLPTIGQFMRPELERILVLRPAACIGLADSTSPQLVHQLERFGIPTLLVNVSRLDKLLESIGEMGRYLGEKELGTRLQQKYTKRLDFIKKQVSGQTSPRVLSVISVSPLYCAGPKTFIADIVRCAGGEPVGLGDGKAWQGLSREAFLWLKPDIIVFAAHTGGIPDWMRRPPLDGARIMSIDPSLIIRPTPRLIDSAEKMAVFFHDRD